MPRLLSHVNFPKVIAVLAVTFVLALGACGVSAVIGHGNFALPFGTLALAVMALSFAGIVVMAIVWAVVQAIGDRGGTG
jgi:hypothetical protein